MAVKKITLGSLLTLKKGKKPKSQSSVKEKGMQPYVDIKAFETGVVDNYTNDDKCVPCNDGDLLIVCDGSRSGYVGRAIKGYTGSTLAKISAEGVDNSYLYYFIQSMYRLLNTQMKGTGTPHLNAEVLKKAELVIPSLDEQKRVVNRIEELFSELDSAVETLKKTKEQLAVYRQSVLKDTFEKYEFSKKNPVTDLVVNEKYALAIGPFGSNLKVSDYTADGVRLVFVKDIRSSFSSETIKFISEKKADELIPHCVYNGDLLITKMGDPPGDCCVYPYEDRGVITSDCIRIKVDESKMNKICLMLYILSAYGKKQIKTMTQGVAQKKISLERFKKFCVPVIGLDEQKMLVEKIQSRLSICENIEKTVNDALAQADAMRQSILKKAFEGSL
jgi:type I restriction enzyme S subunit